MAFPRIIAARLAALASLLLGVACAAGALAAQGGRFSDSLDLLTHFAPLWLAGGVVVLLAAITAPRPRRRIALTALGLAAVVSAATLIAPEYLRPASPRASAEAPRQLKLLQANMWGILAGAELDPQWMVEQRPDIIIMEDGTGLIRENLRKLAPYYVTCGQCGVTIYSLAKPIATGLAPPSPGAPWPRVARATFAAPGGPFTVIGVYYHWPSDPETHAAARTLAATLRQFPQDRLIIAGDFNSTPWSFTRRREDRLFGLERRTRALFSWPQGEFTRFRIWSPAPFLPIDHVYAGSAWRTVQIRRGKDLGSDHAPVIAVLALQPAATAR